MRQPDSFSGLQECQETMDSDENLIMAIRNKKTDRAGAEQAFEKLVKRHQRSVYGYLVGYMKDRHDAEDAMLITFHKIWEKADVFDANRKFVPWMYTIAQHTAFDVYRRTSKHPQPFYQVPTYNNDLEDKVWRESAEATPAENAIEQEKIDSVRRAITLLPEEKRRLLLLFDYKGYKYREIAEIADIPIGTVKSSIFIARNLLKQELENSSVTQ